MRIPKSRNRSKEERLSIYWNRSLTAYRGNHQEIHLKILLRWLARVHESEGFVDIELVVAEDDTASQVRAIVSEYEWAQYIVVPMPRVLNKSVLLNRAAEIANSRYLIPLDVDLMNGVTAFHRKESGVWYFSIHDVEFLRVFGKRYKQACYEWFRRIYGLRCDRS